MYCLTQLVLLLLLSLALLQLLVKDYFLTCSSPLLKQLVED